MPALPVVAPLTVPGAPLALSVCDVPPCVFCKNRRANAAQRRAGLGAQNIGIGNVQVVPGDGDVVVVLKRKRDGIGKAQIDLAVLHQVLQSN